MSVLTVHGVPITGGARHTGQAWLAGVTGLGGPWPRGHTLQSKVIVVDEAVGGAGLGVVVLQVRLYWSLVPESPVVQLVGSGATHCVMVPTLYPLQTESLM